jgi:c-di-GMP-binding flagellar brake protein YcgR
MQQQMMTSTADEPVTLRRRSTRYKVEIRVKVTISSGKQVAAFYGTGTDISASGMGVFIPRDLSLGHTVALELCLPYCRQALKLHAVLRNRRGFHYGVEFSNASLRDRELIMRNCEVLALLQ